MYQNHTKMKVAISQGQSRQKRIDDWIPIYDKSDLPGFYMAVGTSGNQYKNAPVVTGMMADLIDKVEAGHDHDNNPL
jgi:sarcosine oxidase subunit beta